MGEWKRIFNWKMLIVIASIVILNIGLFVYAQMSGRSLSDTIFASNEYEHLVERYQDMPLNDAQDRSTKEYSSVLKYVNSLNPTETQKALSNTTSSSQSDEGSQEMVSYFQDLNDSQKVQMQLEFKDIIAKIKYLNGYPDSIKQVIGNASSLKHFSLFSKPDSFSYNNILKTGKDFERVQNVTPGLTNDKATDAFVNYYYTYYIAFAIMILIIYGLFAERENGMWCMINSAPFGRTRLALKRLLLILTSSFVITGLLYVSTLITSFLVYGGWNDLSTSVQTLNGFAKFTQEFSKLHYLVDNFLLSWAAIFVAAIVLWMLFIFFRNRNHTLILTGAFIGVEILLFNKIQVQSVYNAFRYVNIINLFRINETYSTYNNWGFGIHVYSVLAITFAVLIILLILSGVFAVIKFAHMKPQTKQTLLGRMFATIHQAYQKLFTHFPVTIKEIHKLVITGKGIWVVAAVVIIAIYFSGTGKMNFTDGQIERDQIYLEHGGMDYSYITAYVEQQIQIYNEAKQKLEDTATQYQNGEIDLKTFSKAVSNFQDQANSMKGIQEYSSKIEYLASIKQNYEIDGYMISDRGYEEIFGQYSNQREIILLLTIVTAIMMIISECISMEYRTGMENIVRSCERGRKWIFKKKVAACAIFTILLFGIVYGIDIWNLYHIYGMPYLKAPLMSLTFMEGCAFRVSIFGWMLIRLGARLLICLITMALAIIVSRMIGKKGNRALMLLALAGMIAVIAILHGIGGII